MDGMKPPEQLKGREHMRYINERAVAILMKDHNWEKGNWFNCIRKALKEHREYLIKCVEERKRIESEQKPPVKHCEGCGTELDQMDIFHYVDYCHGCWKARYVDSVCVNLSQATGRPIGRPPGCHAPVKPRPQRGLCL
jgi:hypothetical protein